MGRRKLTEEEKKEKQKEYYQRYREKNAEKYKQYYESRRNGKAVHVEKKFQVRKPGFTATIGTLNRFELSTCYIEGRVTVLRLSQNQLRVVRQTMLDDVKQWLESQDMWDKKQRILIVSVPEYDDTIKVSKTNYIEFQYNLLRRGEFNYGSLVNRWHELHKGIEPFVEHHYQTIKNAVESNGSKIVHKLDKSTIDAFKYSPSNATQEDASLSD